MSQIDSSLVFVDCETSGPCPAMGRLTEFGAVLFRDRFQVFHGRLPEGTDVERSVVFAEFAQWLTTHVKSRPVFVSDNPAFDWQWINDGFHRTWGTNPFGHSARRIGDFYAGLCGDFRAASEWKPLRKTPHDHNPVHDALGNLEAFERMLAGERGPKRNRGSSWFKRTNP